MPQRALPHEHFVQGCEGADTEARGRIWLFVRAITIHTGPDALTVGVGFGSNRVANGLPLAAGTGLQNAPERVAVAVAPTGQHYGRGEAWLVALTTGMVDPAGGLIGVLAVSVSEVITSTSTQRRKTRSAVPSRRPFAPALAARAFGNAAPPDPRHGARPL